MNDQDRQELERLKSRQANLAEELDQIRVELRRLEDRWSSSARELARAEPSPALRVAEGESPGTQPVAGVESVEPQYHEVSAPPVISAPAPVTLPPPIPKPAAWQGTPSEALFSAAPALKLASRAQAAPDFATTPARELTGTPAAVSASGPGKEGSLELRLGTYWLVRVGIVMVLTGLVFFGNLAYQNYISRLGPGGKVSLLYLASAVLLGAGWWWQRRAAKQSLKNYAQVLFAGGLAALYFTTYAAHHIEQLRVIASPRVDGVLLLACAGLMVWAADRKKAEVLALFAVGLAYYTSIITRVGSFTLYSNLVLTVAAVFFLVRNRWAVLTFGSLLASYASYGFWRFFDGSNWHWASPEAGLWTGTYFLISYWLVFTAAVFLSRDEKFAGTNRASFLTVNNGAFFTMFLFTMLQVQTGGFWKFSLIYGCVLLGLAGAARGLLAAEPLAKNAYLTQGLLLVTVGLISKFAGLQLALILAAESLMLLWLGQQRRNRVLLVGAYVAAGMAVGWGIDGMRQGESAGVYLAVGLGGIMLANTLLVHRQTAAFGVARLRARPAYFTLLALVIWLVATYDNASREQFPLLLAGEGLVLMLSIYALGVPEVSLFAQGYVVLAHLAWVFNWFDLNRLPPWGNPAVLIMTTLIAAHWWQHQKRLSLDSQVATVWQLIYSLAIVSVLYFWVSPRLEAPTWVMVSGLLAVGLTAYAVMTRAWMLAACAQIFIVVSSAQFGWQLLQLPSKPPFGLMLVPIVALSALSGGTVQWFRQRPKASAGTREALLEIALIYRWVALAMSIWWICEYIPARERIWLCSLLGLWAFVWSGLRCNQEALGFSAAYTLTAMVLFWQPLLNTPTVYAPNLLAIVLLLAQRQIAVRFPDRYGLDRRVHAAVILVGGLSLWLFLSRWVLENASGFYLTASWSVLALLLFTCGIALHERVYRWLGLGVLASSLGRVVLFDVWKLETIYRVLSFMALGIVLLVLGFIYNKYQEKIKEWL
jgi:uncharacterized membrane protein